MIAGRSAGKSAGRRVPVAALATAVAVLLSASLPSRSLACATCSCGDPTLSVVGAEMPFGGRLRLALDFRHRTDAIGETGRNRIELSEQKLEAKVAWSPIAELLLMASVPYLRREVGYVNGGRSVFWRPGDVELLARWFFFREPSFAPRHLLSWTITARLPTAPAEYDTAGKALPLELQSGTGAFDFATGPAYAGFAGDWSVYASVLVLVPLPSRFDVTRRPSLRGTLAGQWQPRTEFAVRLSADGRLDSTLDEAGQTDPDSGGFILFAGPDVVLSPWTDLLLVAGLRVPVANALRGRHEEGIALSMSVVYDL